MGGCLSWIEHTDRALWAGGRRRSSGSNGSDCVPRRRAEFGQKQTLEIVTKSEFAILILWVILPPLLVGGALMWRLQRGVRPQIAFVLLSLVLMVALLLFGPNWLGRYLGLHDIEFLERHMMWAPLGWVCAIAAWPVAALLSRRKKRMS